VPFESLGRKDTDGYGSLHGSLDAPLFVSFERDEEEVRPRSPGRVRAASGLLESLAVLRGRYFGSK
jgi:hypothetical protein